jgi:hypothetical protein
MSQVNDTVLSSFYNSSWLVIYYLFYNIFFFETPVSSKGYSCGIFDDFNGFMTPSHLTFEINKEQISGGGVYYFDR